jgi:serine/alanine adding enzyme
MEDGSAAGAPAKGGESVPTMEHVAVAWDERVLASHSLPHFMQSTTWAGIREGGPWRASRRDLGTGAELPALAFLREAEGFGILEHFPRVSGIAPADVASITDRIREERGSAFATKIEVHQARDPALEAAFLANGWLPTRASQYRYGVVVDTSKCEEEILASMRKRARSEIRAGERNGVTVERVELTAEHRRLMLALVETTAARSGAYFRPAEYLERVWSRFTADDRGRLYFARHDGAVVAGAFIAIYGTTAWFKDGGSTRDQPQLMASRLLQWAVIRELAAAGIRRYDLGHVPPPGDPDAPGQGVLTFKSAFAPDVTEYLPAFHLGHEPQAEQWRRDESAFVERHLGRTGEYWY